MGANWGDAKGMTPNLDKIADEGIRFTDFHVAASVCSVSRAALLTGRLGLRNGVTHNFGVDSMYGLPRTENTIAELLKPVGYRTGIVGKWHLGTTPGYHPSYRGFDHYLGIPWSVDMGCVDQKGVTHDKPPISPCSSYKPTNDANKLPLPLYQSTANCSGQTSGSCNGDIIQQPVEFTTLTDKYRSFASDFIGHINHDKSPFFLYVPFSHMHVPQYTAPRNVGKSGKTGDSGFFYDTLLEVDETIGFIMESLKENGVDNNTLVLVTGDNGPWEEKCKLAGSTGPFKGIWQKSNGGGSSSKFTLWEGGHRMAALARWPNKIKPRVSNATTSSLDYLPTIAKLAGVELPADRVYDGLDISDVLFDGSETAHETLFHPNSGASGKIGNLDGIRWKNYKAIYQTGGAPDCNGNKGNSIRHSPPLLFDLESDSAEEHALDVTKEPYKSVLGQIVKALNEQMRSINSTFASVVNYTQQINSEPCAHIDQSLCKT
eukprot:CAMPEP_0175123268 /NCGR_PEP_ID=MMETSP0087-20121206/2151_1 /TAXON_ID=136419 /ORGANISM="Unknown Unknown, Strain D1" /LENGTH=487 /DNA_ID=CAMNT_0016404945 /DNA_START=176 /DNA_END=1639 /DNA_ORIENTATION=-